MAFVAVDGAVFGGALEDCAGGAEDFVDGGVVGEAESGEQFGHGAGAAPVAFGEQFDGVSGGAKRGGGIILGDFEEDFAVEAFGEVGEERGVQVDLAIDDAEGSPGFEEVDFPLFGFEEAGGGREADGEMGEGFGAGVGEAEIVQEGDGVLVRGEADFGGEGGGDLERHGAGEGGGLRKG